MTKRRYLHIGGGCVLTDTAVIAVLDPDTVTKNQHKFLLRAQETNTLCELGFPRSVVVTDRMLYLSPVTPQIIRERTKGL